MAQNPELEFRIKDVLRVVPISDKELLEETSDQLIQRVRFISSLDDSYSPGKELIKRFYWEVEQDAKFYVDTLLINPEGARDILRSRNQEAQRYEILRRVVEGLLEKEARDYFSRHNLQTQHFPHDLLASFSSIRKVMEEGEVNIGVAIGPEGFVYASIFGLLGLPVKNIQIDEYCTTEDRPYKELDDLSAIKGKHTLFIEDDVRTGKTLKKVYDKIKRYSPADVSVYLGIPERGQNLHNVPRKFRKIYTTPNNLNDEQIRTEVDKVKEILGRKYPIFRK